MYSRPKLTYVRMYDAGALQPSRVGGEEEGLGQAESLVRIHTTSYL